MDSGFALMDRAGVDPKHAVGREGWTAIKCSSKRAYGCGKGGNSAVQDLDLFVSHGDLENLSSALSVRAGDKVFRWIDKVIAEKGGDNDRYFRSKVEIVDKGLIVLTTSFSEYSGFDYYIVFDYFDGSLSMIPYLPDWATCYTTCPLPLRHHDGGYSLILFGGEFGYDGEGGNNLLWQWSPSWGASSDPWQTRRLRLPAEMEGQFFSPDVLFSFNGFAFWTDLAIGTLCCHCSALLSEGHPLNFTFTELPPGYQLDRDDDDVLPVEVYRTMGCAGGSVKFISIDKPCDGRGTRVKVWTLAPSRSEWKLYKDFRLKNLRKDFKSAGLPNNLPICPMLREQEDTTLYFIMPDQETRTMDWGHKYHLCRLDMPTKSLLQSKLLAHTTMDLDPVILPSGFFDYLDPLPSSPETNNSSPETINSSPETINSSPEIMLMEA
ncbi:unnamed protein product [Alopecurus aequalis]